MPGTVAPLLKAWLSSFEATAFGHEEPEAATVAPPTKAPATESPAPEAPATGTPAPAAGADEADPHAEADVAANGDGPEEALPEGEVDNTDPIHGGSEDPKAAQFMTYPMVGIINNYQSQNKSYVVAPDYWVSWGRPEEFGKSTNQMSGTTSPPAVWVQERARWQNTWKRLSSGDEGLSMPWSAKPYPVQKKKSKLPGGSKLDKWWRWLDGREKSEKWRTETKPDLLPKKRHKNFNDGTAKDPCKLYDQKLEYKPPKDPITGEPLPFIPGQAFDKEGRKAGCFCPGPDCVYDDEQGFFGWATPKQLSWENDNLMRRQTLPGLSDALSEDGEALRHASVRRPRLQQRKGKEPATLDPRPPQPVENPYIPGMTIDKMPKVKPYPGGSMLGDVGRIAADAAAQMLVGGDFLSMKAFMRLQNMSHGEWLTDLTKKVKADKLFADGKEKEARALMGDKEEEAVVERRHRKRDENGLVKETPDPLWHRPPPQKFKDEYEMRYRKFWPAMEVLARRAGSGPARLAGELGQEWKAGRLIPQKQPEAFKTISDSAGYDVRSARHALGGPAGKEEEAIDAVDLVLPVPQPATRQARSIDRPVWEGPTPPANTAVQVGAAMEETAQARRALLAAGPAIGPTTHSGIGPLGASAGAVLLSTTWNDMQILARDARLARWRPARRPGRRRLDDDAMSFL